MEFFGRTDIGKTRTSNQDSFFADYIQGKKEAESCGLLCVVCDGMGGAAGGKIASSMAIDVFTSQIKKKYSDDKYENKEELVSDCVQMANKSVFSRSTSDESLSGMGTTLTSALICDNKVTVSNVGDSRLYVFKNKKAKQITRDHSYVQELLDLGQITNEQAKNHPRRNIITRALGTEKYVEVDTFTITDKIDGLLLCSDGLYNMVEEKTMKELFYSEKSLEDLCGKLIDMANNAGGSDNITVVAVRYKA